MSNFKSIVLLLLLLTALVSANMAVRFGRSDISVAGRPMLLEPEDDVVQLVIERKGEAGTVLSCESGHWTLVSPFSGNVDEQVVLKILDLLSSPLVQDVISDAELLKLGRTHGDFSLDTPVLRLTVVTADRQEITVLFGSSTPSADGTYVTVSGSEGVFVVPSYALKVVDLPPDGFRRRSLVLSDAESVSAFDIRDKARANLEFVRGRDGWMVSGLRASTDKVEKFVADLCSAEARSFVWPRGSSNESARASASLLASYGLDPESAITVSIKGKYETIDQISFGKESEGGSVYALIQNGSAVVTVPAALKDVVEQASDRFTDSRLFPLEVRTVSQLSVSSGNLLYALSRDKSGLWRLESPIAAPAEQDVVETVLSRVLALTAADVVPNGGVLVSVMTNAVGAQVLRESVLGQLTFEDLRSKEMLRVDPALVKRIVRQEGAPSARSDSVLYVRDRRVWSIETSEAGVAADVKGVETVLRAVSPLVAERIEKLKVPAANLDSYGLDAPYLTIAIDLDVEDSVRCNILIGKSTGKGRYATVGSSDAVFVLSEEQVAKLSAAIVEKEGK